jgi:hypothetical protein
MSFFKKLIKVIEASNKNNSYNKNTTRETTNNKTKISPNNDKDFQLLLSLYKKNKIDDIDMKSIVNKENPKATEHMCPYCEVVHEFKASRARKCPNCSNKMVVRQGLFITEEQAKNIEKKVNKFYERQGLLHQVQFSLESAQDHKVNKDVIYYYRSLAESFRFMAQVENQKDEKGLSFWDKAWGYYNSARLEEMKNLRKDNMEFSNLPDIFWDMSKMLLDQANFENKERYKRKALTQACMTIAESIRLGSDLYFITDVYEFSKKIIGDLSIDEEEFEKISEEASSAMRLDNSNLKDYNNKIKELLEYEIIR